jgi:hypothetical protein
VVFPLDVGGVGKHDSAEIARCGRGVHRAVKPFLYQEREAPGVIDVSMAQDNAI